MHLKAEAVLLLTIIFIISYTRPTDAYCSLERMKKFAIEACEHLFLQDETREKRSIGYKHNLVNTDDYADHKRHYVSRSIYPAGGYLKVDRERYRKLSEVDVYPKYKARKIHSEKRFKRDFAQRYDNIPYCCFNRCEEDFFC